MPQNSEWCAWPGSQGMDYALLQTERAKPVGFEVITQTDADMHVRRTRLVYRNYRGIRTRLWSPVKHVSRAVVFPPSRSKRKQHVPGFNRPFFKVGIIIYIESKVHQQIFCLVVTPCFTWRQWPFHNILLSPTFVKTLKPGESRGE